MHQMPAQYGYGDFGNLSRHYDSARHGVPQVILNYLWQKFESPTPSILDVGCGTGISTRQLLNHRAHVIGADRDSEMIDAAIQQGPRHAAYVVAPVHQLPFENEHFDAVTAFSAFHWFANKKSLDEIQRVLKPGGIICVVNKNDVGDFKRAYKAILAQFIEGDLPNVKICYDPKTLLSNAGLQSVEEKLFETQERFTVPKAITYLQSVSSWNLVPSTKKRDVLKKLRGFCQERCHNGFVERKLEIVVVTSRKTLREPTLPK